MTHPASSTANPLLDFSGLPRFPEIRAEHVGPAIDILIDDARAAIEAAAAVPAAPTWDNFVQPLADSLDRLDQSWGEVSHLNAVLNSPELREAYKAGLAKLSSFYTDFGQDERMFARYRALADSPEFANLTRAQQTLVRNAVRDFRLSGAELSDEKKARFKAVQEELSREGSRFEDNVLDATNAFALYVEDAAELAGVPADVMDAARAAAEEDGKPGWKITLRMPSYYPVMQYARNRALRETLYRGFAVRASELGNPEWDNSAVMRRILELRKESADLLGYGSFAELSLVPKMAGSPEEVLGFLRELATRAKPYAVRDMEELREFAAGELGLPEIAAWDIAFASERLREDRYSFSDQEVKEYFPEDRVLSGLFRVVETIYGVLIRASEAPVWHPDVRFFDVLDAAGAIVGQFYLDLYARPNKRGGAWMDDAISRRRHGGKVQHPVAFLTCNFAPPAVVDGRRKPALFTHDDVITLFHEFGHGLHLLLTQVDVAGVSGIEGVEWDAVELPSQFMENYCWEWSVLEHMSAFSGDGPHAGEPLPRTLFDKMIAAKNFQSGMQTVRQLEFALFDMHLHHDFDLNGAKSVDQLLQEVRREVAVVPRPAFDRSMTHSFSHIFSGGYAAGYYSYKWAEVLSADAFSLFEERGVLSPEAGALFRDEVLAQGGSRPAMESFVAFRGRPPQIDALLRHNGMSSS